MNKNVEQHLDELIEYYRDTSIDDAGYLKKLFVRNLGDVKRRYVKYDKPKFDNLEILKEKVDKLEILIENLKLGVTLNQEQEDLLDEILFRGNKK
jgi:hypothetical protein